MKKSEELKQKIDALKKEYDIAKQEESLELIWDDSRKGIFKTCEMVGFFNLTKARLILGHLDKGDVLMLDHQALGRYKVYMNPQRNRILVEWFYGKEGTINEKNIEGFILWNSGNWYVINDV